MFRIVLSSSGFSISSINLATNGYLLFIHPVSWRRKSKEIKIINSLLNKRIKYIYTNNKFRDFGISAPFINYYFR